MGEARTRAVSALVVGLLLAAVLSGGSVAGADQPEVGTPSVDRTWQAGSAEGSARTGGDVQPAASGDLDLTWSGDGIASVQSKYFPTAAGHGAGELAVGLYKDSDGQGRFRVWDFNTAGAPDPTWGGGLGYVLRTFRVGGVSFPTQTVPYDGGQIVVGAWNDGNVARVGITRLRSDGTYRSVGSYTGRTLYKVFANEHDHLEPFSAAVYGNGRVMVAVAAFDYNANGDLVYVGQAVFRVNGVGGLDTTFSGDGVLPVAKDVGDIAFRSDGGTYLGRRVSSSSHEIRKLLSNGAYDGGFSGDGRALVPCGSHVGAYLRADTAGRVVVGCVRLDSGYVDFRVARMTTAGVLDTTYSGNGLAAIDLGTEADPGNWTFLIDPTGRTFASAMSRTSANAIGIWSLDASGEPNAAFSGDGFSFANFPSDVRLLQMTQSGNRLFVVAGRGTVYVDLIAFEL